MTQIMDIDITWADEFLKNISPYIYVREKDSLLILLPNQAYKLNPSGIVMLKRMMAGEQINDVLESKSAGLSSDPNVIADVHHFFCDLRALINGCLCDIDKKKAIEIKPFTRPHNLLPVLSEIAVTYRCNLSCKFCYAGCKCSQKPDIYEMSTSEIKRVLDIIRYDAEVPSVSWTGGEPTIRTDLAELTEYATKIGLRVNLITNGTLLNESRVKELADAGLKSAQISIEGSNAKVHDGLTQFDGSFEKTVNAVKYFQDAGLHVHTNTTVNSLNAPYLLELVDFISTIGTQRFSMNMVIPCGSADEDVSISYVYMKELIEKVQEKAKQAEVEFMWYSPTPYCIFNPVKAGLGGKSCAACDGLLSVSPNGDVLPCSSVPDSVGNLLKQPFDKVWDSRKAVYWRKKKYAHKICTKCESFDICTGACPIYWDNMGYKELEEARL